MSFTYGVFLFLFGFGFGFLAGNAERFNFWKSSVLFAVLFPAWHTFGYDNNVLFVVIAGFAVGFMLPYAYVFGELFDVLQDAVNAFRYKDAYAEIRRKEAEIERMREELAAERARYKARDNQEKAEQARQKRKKESEDWQRQKAEREAGSGGAGSSGSGGQSKGSGSGRGSFGGGRAGGTGQSTGKTGNTTRARYLEILELDPNGTYSYAEIKKAYRRQASKFHPDKHSGKSESYIREMGERFKQVQEAYEWLGVT